MKIDGIRAVKTAIALSSMFVVCNQGWALPFTIMPKTGLPFPTSMNIGQPVTAFYTVTNNTASVREGNFVKYLPPNVSQVKVDEVYPDLCGATFTLAPGGSCTLELLVSGAVNGNAANPRAHLFVCFPGGKTCAGTPVGLNVALSGWVNTQFSGGGAGLTKFKSGQPVDAYIHGLFSSSTAVFAYGHTSPQSGVFYGAVWQYLNGAWSVVDQSNVPDSSVESMTVADPTTLYFGGDDAEKAEVFRYDVTHAQKTSLHLVDPSPPADTTVVVDEVNSLVYGDGLLYAGTEGTQYSTLQPPGPTLYFGQVYSYDGHAWTNLGLMDLEHESPATVSYVNSLAYAPQTHTLYAAAVSYQGDSNQDSLKLRDVPPDGDTSEGGYAEVYAYIDGNWVDTNLTDRESKAVVAINSLAVDSNGILYAAGFDKNYVGGVWKYQNGVWTSLNFAVGTDVTYLTIDSHNTLYAAGTDNNFAGQVWSYSNGAWSSLGLASSASVQGIITQSCSIYAAGANTVRVPYVWGSSICA